MSKLIKKVGDLSAYLVQDGSGTSIRIHEGKFALAEFSAKDASPLGEGINLSERMSTFAQEVSQELN